MYLHLEVASLDFGKRWQAQGYGQAKLTLMQATTSEYLQHLSKAGSMYSDTGFETKEEVVAGTMHHLSLEIIEAGKELYEEKLWVKPWLNFNESIMKIWFCGSDNNASGWREVSRDG
ncbi:BnaCnng46420D [Brassica napus]|nr:BnaCnng46420D [Brassica napus]